MTMKDTDHFYEFLGFFNELNTKLNKVSIKISDVEIKIVEFINNHSKVTSKDIQVYFNLDKGYLSRILNKLDNGGYTKRNQSKKDKRISYINLTKLGKEKLVLIKQEKTKLFKDSFKHLSSTEFNMFIQSLDNAKRIYNKETTSVSIQDVVIEKRNTSWNAIENKKTIATLFLTVHTTSSGEIVLLKDAYITNELIISLFNKALQYCENNLIDHLYLIDFDSDDNERFYSQIGFIKTETFNENARYDYYLSFE